MMNLLDGKQGGGRCPLDAHQGTIPWTSFIKGSSWIEEGANGGVARAEMAPPSIQNPLQRARVRGLSPQLGRGAEPPPCLPTDGSIVA